ncbi:hypothetical protein V6N11_075535 [Hibiscus sabdariffa]|uniref:Uncharacterized protein n=1 Tax=Hibiscus sabdariffa TaxID=183260 RepID=A0ABR2R789_9ROSI
MASRSSHRCQPLPEFQYCIQMISVILVGHLGELPLSAASMATSFATVTGFSLLVNHVKWLAICKYIYILDVYCVLVLHSWEWQPPWTPFADSRTEQSNIPSWAFTCKEQCLFL